MGRITANTMDTMPDPPWIQCPYPHWGYGSMAWRMSGEDVWWNWVDEFQKLSMTDREAYMAKWPAPEGWEEFYPHWMSQP